MCKYGHKTLTFEYEFTIINDSKRQEILLRIINLQQ